MGSGKPLRTHELVGKLLHSFGKFELIGNGPNYRIELSELKLNVNSNIKLNTPKIQLNRYRENVLYRVLTGNLKFQNRPTAYINGDVLVFKSGHDWKPLLWVVRFSFIVKVVI